MAEAIELLRARGFRPRVVIDGGANVGTWSRMASAIFPDAAFHLVEPQTACHERLADLQPPRYHVHRYALTGPGVTRVTVTGSGAGGVGTGAHVVADPSGLPPEVDAVAYEARTLDALFASTLVDADRAFLKLDVEGHELEALKGADAVLPRIEVILSEVSFVDFYRTGHILFADVHDYLRDRGFELYDFAALSPRPRDKRLRQADPIFVRKGSALLEDVSWD